VNGLFFPQRIVLKIDQREYSPAIIEKIAFAGASNSSAKKGSRALLKLAGLKISGMEVMRITGQIGLELLASREHDSALHRRRELKVVDHLPVSIACIEVDGGRMRTRSSGKGRGVHDEAWKETKVAALWRMEGPTFDCDPHPEPQRCFCDAEHVAKMVREIKRQRSEQHGSDSVDDEIPLEISQLDPEAIPETTERQWPPRRIFRTCVATFKDVYGFGPLVAAEAQRRGFYEASRQAFLGDGDHKNWTVHKLHFPHFTAITDFVHPVTYLYDVAGAVTNSLAAHWEQYVEWMTANWQGRIGEVIAELHTWQTRLGLPEQEMPVNDPRRIVSETITYLQNNRSRMNYPDYRKQGLPITSCLIESLIKEINYRVKGSEKFWNRLDATEGEAMLQATAALLCDGDPLSKHIANRPGSLYYRRSTEVNLNAAISPK
jgi:hypothetical protein